MSLRDYFAAQALCGMLSAAFASPVIFAMSTSHASRIAYEYAEAMLDERARPAGQEP